MKKLAMALTVTFIGLGIAAISGKALADHVDGHEPCDPVFPCPLPGENLFNGGAMWVSLIGPVEDSIITGTTFEITWVSDGATPARDLLLHGTVQVDDDYVEFTVTGEDLGFGDGPGKFTGTFSTDELNGVAWPNFLVAPYSIVDLQVDAVGGGGIQGYAYFFDSFINFDLIPAPSCRAELDACAVLWGALNGGGECDPADLSDVDDTPLSVNTRPSFLASCPNQVEVTIDGNLAGTGFAAMNQLYVTDKLTLGQGAEVHWEAVDFVNGGTVSLGSYAPGTDYAMQTLAVNNADIVDAKNNFAFQLKYTTCVVATFVANGATHAVDQVIVTGH